MATGVYACVAMRRAPPRQSPTTHARGLALLSAATPRAPLSLQGRGPTPSERDDSRFVAGSPSCGRVRKELEECQRDTQVSGVVAVARDPNVLTHLQGTLQGPPGTPYEGGVFQLEIIIPSKYPFEPPKIRFETKIWHPNISSQTGAICLDILKDQWSPALTIKTALLSIQALLSAAEPSDPQDAEVAKMYMDDHDQFVSTARFWTETYAKERSTDDAAVSRLTDMGFPADQAKAALLACQGDESAAIEKLLSSM